ncbi:hypothetical protein GCM10009839_21620 [Catenulispora yoronensis]|uniref:CARDB domain-containing protein n=1 Tax=Catenulispora yoronensis TaxID=450799 RepID=A0ABN2TWF9_9ACTN
MQIPAAITAGVLALLMTPAVQAAPARSSAAVPPASCTTLHDLGASSIDISDEITSSREIPGPQITFPAGASQGPATWYVIHLHAAVTLQPGDAGSGATLTAGTDGADASQVVYTTADGGGIDWGATSIAERTQTGHVASGPIEVDVANYMRDAGVKPGPNPIAFKISTFGGAKVEHLRIFDDTCIEKTNKSPDRVHLTAPATISGAAGSTLTVPLTVHNDGTGTVKDVSLTVSSTDPDVTIEDGGVVRVPQLVTESAADLKLLARTPGAHTVHVTVSTATQDALGGTDLSINVEKKTSHTVAYATAGAAIVLIALGVLVFRRPRRRAEAD